MKHRSLDRSRGARPARLAVLEPSLTYARALGELAAVHRLDQARLLRQACALACAGSVLGPLYVAACVHAGSESSRLRARSAWNRACAEEIASAGADGFPVAPALPCLLELPSASWPRPTSVARASLDLEPSHGGRVELARAWIVEEDPSGAIDVLATLLEERPLPAVRCAVLEALALAFELAGEHRSSLACYRAAVVERRSDVRVAVALLALALRLGDRSGVSLATKRLAPVDLSVAGTRRRFEHALRAAQGRSERDLRAAPHSTDEGIRRRILEMALAGPRACSEVARRLL